MATAGKAQLSKIKTEVEEDEWKSNLVVTRGGTNDEMLQAE